MLDNLLTNKYLMIALILILVYVLFIYSQKRSCGVEGMENMDLTPLAQELTQRPWTDFPDGDNHGRVNTRFDKRADAYVKAKLLKNGYGKQNFLERSDQNFEKYMDDADNREPKRVVPAQKVASKPFHDQYDEDYNDVMEDYIAPRPLDARPDLSQCQPCNCDDKPRRRPRHDDEELTDLESETPVPKKKAVKSK